LLGTGFRKCQLQLGGNIRSTTSRTANILPSTFLLLFPNLAPLTLLKLYLNKDRQKSEELLQKVERLGASAIVFTVDVMMQTKRTLDVRTKHLAKKPAPAQASKDDKVADPPEFKAGVSQAISGYQDFNMTWGDLDLIRVSGTFPPHNAIGKMLTCSSGTQSSRSLSKECNL
jgi:hypothetical protein